MSTKTKQQLNSTNIDNKSIANLLNKLQKQAIKIDFQNQAIKTKDNKILILEDNLKNQENWVEALKEEIRLLRIKRFGSSTEKYKSGQLEFVFDEIETIIEDESIIKADEDEIQVPAHTRKKVGRKKLPADLPREEKIYDLNDDEKFCDIDGTALVKIGEDISEQLKIIPAKIVVVKHVRFKYACPNCKQTIKTAKYPNQPIPKSIASPELLAHVAVSKYQDALPLYRQEKIFKRIGVDIPRATLASWMIKGSQLFIPLINLFKDKLTDSKLIHMDETPIQVLKEKDKPPSSKSYMWVQASGKHDHPIVLYEYSSSRSQQVAKDLLEDYTGLLQTDGYAGYNAIAKKDGIILLGCFAHARRKFMDIVKVSKNKSGKANVALSYIQKLYRIEKLAKDKTPNEILQIRQEQSKPIIDSFKKWLDDSIDKVPPSLSIGKAIAYTLNQWPQLIGFIDNGYAAIDNNKAENAIRPFVIGRKNWLFANSVNGANASARLYSIIETAKANNIEPYEYLKVIFTKLPNAKTVEDIEALLPWNFKIS